MKKIVISGSTQLQEKIKVWIQHFEEKGYEVLDYPRLVKNGNKNPRFPDIYKKYYKNLEQTHAYFLMNEDKNGVKGYIGASAIAELTYVVIQNLLHKRNIKIFILKIPSEEVNSYDEVSFWLEQGWIQIYHK